MPVNRAVHGAHASQTKIVATVGPACDSREKLDELASVGVDVFRLNTAHATREQSQARLDDIRHLSDSYGQPLAVLVDLAGPKIRLGELPDGFLDLDMDAQVTFLRSGPIQGPESLGATYPRLIDELAPGDRVMLADGVVSLLVESKTSDAATCRVVQPGRVRSKQGVNLPGVKLSVPALNDGDRDNARWAARQGVAYLGLSFVRRPEDIFELKSLIAEVGSGTQVIAKIEKPEAVARIEEIVAAADGVMVARGDLGVEIDIAEIARTQKRIIAECRKQRKPVIVATQMLDSMQHSRLPTRAEVTDVANAILDGADAVMLSGETAIGEYPRESVEMMHRIAIATEPLLAQRPHAPPQFDDDSPELVSEATVYAAGRLAEIVKAKLMVVASATGRTALAVAESRFSVPVVGVSDSGETLRRMCLYWGIHPLPGAPVEHRTPLLSHVTQWGRDAGLLQTGDKVVLVASESVTGSRHNMLVVHEV